MRLRNTFLIIAALAGAVFAVPAMAQSWAMVETEATGGEGAFICAAPGEAETAPPCFQLACTDSALLHYEIALSGPDAADLPEELAVEIRVDGRASGLLLFGGDTPQDGTATLTAPFDPRLHSELVAQLRRGNRAELVLQRPAGAITVPLSLKGSSKTLAVVMKTCPMPEVPLNDPAAVVLDEIVRECGQLGGSVAMEPGFERREDLDGDGREDVVIDYAAAVCSQMASLYCGSGGCTVGFFLAREKGFQRIYDGVIRGYSAQPGGLLALDLHGTACGLYGFEACRKVFRIADDSFALVEELAGEAAEEAMAADGAATAGSAAMSPEAEAALAAKAEAEAAAKAEAEAEAARQAEAAAERAAAEAAAKAEAETAAKAEAEAAEAAAEAAEKAEAEAIEKAAADAAAQAEADAAEKAEAQAAAKAEAEAAAKAEVEAAAQAEADAEAAAQAEAAADSVTPELDDAAAQTTIPTAPTTPVADDTEADPTAEAPLEPQPDPSPAPVEPVEADATGLADPPESELAPALNDEPATGLEWIGDGDPVILPLEGERLPDDLLPNDAAAETPDAVLPDAPAEDTPAPAQ